MLQRFLNRAYASPRYLKIVLTQELKQRSLTGMLNLAQGFLAVRRRPEELRYELTVLQIEPTINCNLNCRVCEHTHNVPGAFLKFAQFKGIIDQMPCLRQVNLTGRGESLLNPDIYRMIAYAREKDIYTRITTNGTLLTEKNCQEIISCGLDELRISVDSAQPEKFRRIKSNVDLKEIEENIRRLNSLRRQRRLRPALEFNTILFRENIDEIEDIIRLAYRLQVDAVFTFGLVLKDNALAHSGNLLETLEEEEIKKIFQRAMALSKKLRMPLRLPQNYKKTLQRCFMPWVYFFVTYDGFVLPCCMAVRIPQKEDKMAEYAMGNILENPWKEIKNNDKFRDFRKQLQNGKVPRVCAGCNILDGTF